MVRRNRSESRAGQLLAEIEPPEVDQELNQASPELLHSGSSYNDVAGQQRAQSYQTATPRRGITERGGTGGGKAPRNMLPQKASAAAESLPRV